MEMDNHNSQKIMLHYNIHYILHCSACAAIIYVKLSACCFVLTVPFFHNSTRRGINTCGILELTF